MKIAILTYHSGIYERGVERWVKELALRLSKSHEIVVYQNGSPGSDDNYKVVTTNLSYEPEKQEILFPLQKRAFVDYKGRKIAQFVLKIIPELWKGNFDIIIPTDGGWEPALIRILTWLKRKKMVIVGHAGIGWDDRNNLWCFPDYFIALSSFAKSWVKRVNPFVKIEYIPDGVDLRRFKMGGVKLKTGLREPIVLCVGALTSSKRIGLTIKAVAKLKNTSLLVVGKGEEEKELRSLGKKLLKRRFLLTSCDFGKIPEVYRSADIFTSASTSRHSFEMVLLEAMATNLPVVANDDPIRKEIVGNAGMLVDPEDTDAYVKALKKALNTKWGNKPRQQAEKFSWDEVVEKYERLFSSLVH